MKLRAEDLKIETFRPAGAPIDRGSSAVRVTHIPSGHTAECSEYKSHRHNLDQAIEELESKVYPPECPIEKAFGKPPKKGYKFLATETILVDNDTFKGFVVKWSAQGIGFGECFFGWGLECERLKEFPKQQGFHLDTECMSDEFVDALLKEAYPQILELMLRHRRD